MILYVLIYSVINSMVILLTAIGFSIVFGISGIANFAHGALLIIVGYATWFLITHVGIPYFFAMFISAAFVALLGVLIYRVAILPVRGMMFSEVIVSYGLAVAILEFFRWAGLVFYDYNLPLFFKGEFEIAGVVVDYQGLMIVILSIAVLIALWYITHRINFGLALRAIAQDEYTALSLGIDSDATAALSLAIGGILAAIAAYAILPLRIIHVNFGYDVLILSLVVTVFGGVESLGGLLLASFILGFLQTIIATYLATHWIQVIYLFILMVVLAFKPSGLFGKFHEMEERV